MFNYGGEGAGEFQEINLIGGALNLIINKNDAKMEEDKNPEEIWHLVLHSYKVNNFQHVQCALYEVVITFD